MSPPESTHEHNSPPSWEVQTLVCNSLDAKTLATAACVSKSWRAATTSSDHIWKQLATSDFPSLTSTLKTFVQPSLPYRRIYALAHSAAAKHPRPKPSLSLRRLIFAVHLTTTSGNYADALFSGPAEEVAVFDPNGVFRFDIDVATRPLEMEGAEEVRMTWHALVRDDNDESKAPSVLTLMDSVVKVRKEAAGEAVGWFSEEVPQAPGCCCCYEGSSSSRMVADLKMGFGSKEDEDGGMRVEKVSLGLLSTEKWRYVSVDDGLRYLQHFLLEK
ncbi:Probable F-box protein At5g04010 [Linum grandiflorum]